MDDIINKVKENIDLCTISYDMVSDSRLEELEEWCRKHCKHNYSIKWSLAWFSSKDDAMMFKMRWKL